MKEKSTLKQRNHILKKVINFLDFIYNNELLSTERKLDQGYAFVMGINDATDDQYYNDVVRIYDYWRFATHPAYRLTYDDYEKVKADYL